MEWWLSEMLAPIGGAIVAGALVGFERDYRGRWAGLRTHALIAAASAVLMVMAVHQMAWMEAAPEVVRIDPVRMAHGVLTGIGFLCGGVIFREGFSVHGLTTAATMWMTASLGLLFGVGFWSLGVAATLATLAILLGLRLVEHHLPQRLLVDAVFKHRRGEMPDEDEFRRLMGACGLEVSHLGYRLIDAGAVEERRATLSSRRGLDMSAIAGRLYADPRFWEFELKRRND